MQSNELIVFALVDMSRVHHAIGTVVVACVGEVDFTETGLVIRWFSPFMKVKHSSIGAILKEGYNIEE